MKVKLFFIVFLLFFAFNGYSQKEVPYPVFPGQSTTNNTKDTLWVLHSTKQFKKVSIALNNQKSYKKLLEKHKQLIDTLDVIKQEKSTYIDSLKSEYQICLQEAQKMYDNSLLLGELNARQTKHKRIAIIVGATTTVMAFVMGFVLGK